MKNINIGDAELEVLKVIWSETEPVSSAEINNRVESHGWKRTTIATFLSRLTEKRGKTMYYVPILTEREYKRSQLKNLIKNVFDGSAQNLVASLFQENELTDKDIEELKKIFKE